MHRLLFLLSFFSAVSALAQTAPVIKTKATNALTESIVIKSGTSLTINSGASITNNGTATGFGSGGTWGSITGTLSNQTDLNTALGLKANSADLGALATLSAVSSATITDGTIVNADIANGAAIALSKLAVDPLSRDNHTGTQLMATIADAGTMALQNADSVDISGGIANFTGLQVSGSNPNDALSFDPDSGQFGAQNSLGGASYLDLPATAEVYTYSFPALAAPGGDVVVLLSEAQTLFQKTISGAANTITNLNASNLSSGSVPAARIATGTITNAMLAGSIAASKLIGTDIGTVGTITAGTWNGSTITSGYLSGDDAAYDATSWNGATSPPSKNAVRDRIESMGAGAVKRITVAKKTDTASVSGSTWTTVFSVTHNVQVSGSVLAIKFAGAGAATTGGYNAYFRIRVSSTTLAEGDTAGSRTLTGVALQINSGAVMRPFTAMGYHTTTATGDLTIELQMRSDSGGTAYLNRTTTDSDNAAYMRGATTAEVIEYVNP